MDCFENGRAVRLRSHYGKYLVAMEDKVSVTQDRNESDNCATWTIELNTRNNNIRLKSCYDMYLTASTESSNLGLIGSMVIQSLQPSSDSSVEWKPIRDGDKIKFQTESGSYLRADGSVPPLRNMVTHKVPTRSPVHQHYLWDVDSLGTQVHKPTSNPGPGRTPAAPKMNPRNIKDAAITGGAMVGKGGAISSMVTPIKSEIIGKKKANEEEDAANSKAAIVADDAANNKAATVADDAANNKAAIVADDEGDQAAGDADNEGDHAAVDADDDEY